MTKTRQFYFLELIDDADRSDLANDYLRVIYQLVDLIEPESLELALFNVAAERAEALRKKVEAEVTI